MRAPGQPGAALAAPGGQAASAAASARAALAARSLRWGWIINQGRPTTVASANNPIQRRSLGEIGR